MTLIEIMVAIAIGAFLIAVLGVMIVQTWQVTTRANDRLAAYGDVQNAARWLNTDFNTASQATISTTQVILKVPVRDPSQQQAVMMTDTLTYTVSLPELRRKYADKPTQVTARYLGSISFLPMGTVTNMVTVTLSSVYNGVTSSATLNIGFRAGK